MMNKNVSVEKFALPFDSIEEVGNEILSIKGGSVPSGAGEAGGEGCGCGCGCGCGEEFD